MDILLYIKVAVVVLLFFGASIFVHEFGHFWVARRRGMKVEEFAIGFGPKLFSWTRDGVVYSLRAIPAGGFVKLPQMITSEALEGGNAKEEIPPASPVSKILVAVAGPVMNVIFAFIIATFIYFVGLPILVNPSVIGYVEPGSEEEKMGIKPGDRIVAIDSSKVDSWQRILMNTALAPTNVFNVSIVRDGVTNIYQLTARQSADTGGLKLLNLGSQEHPVVGGVLAGNPADKAGLKAKDKILTFDGIQMVSQEQLVEIVSKRGGKECVIEVERDGQKLALKVTPHQAKDSERAMIGISFAGSYYQVQRPGPLPWLQLEDVVDQTFRTLNALFHSKQTGVGLKDLSGPPGIFAMLASRVNTDYRLALSFLVLLNINLAVLNMLPIPVLDGGHIVMSIIEKIRRKPMSLKFVEYTTTAFAILMISLMVYVSFNDIKRFKLFKAMFQQETRIEEPGATNNTTPTPATNPAK